MEKQKYKRNSNVVLNSLDDVHILLETETGVLANLNDTALEIWNLCEDPISEREILNKMIEIYEIDRETLQQDLRETLDSLVEMNMLLKEV
ncbi:PqqD family protein [bacterium]|nr:PqqD family protein [bacterium]